MGFFDKVAAANCNERQTSIAAFLGGELVMVLLRIVG
jgi:hypothetical protein